jgi:subtilisin family serine protease
MRLAILPLLTILLVGIALANPATAPWLQTDGTPETFVFEANQHQIVRFNLTQGNAYELRTQNITSTATTDTVMRLLASDLTVIAINDDDLRIPPSQNSRIVFVAPQTATHYANITEWAGTGGGTYNVSLTQLGKLVANLTQAPATVSSGSVFTVNASVTCAQGYCGEVTVYLDPEEKELQRIIQEQGEVNVLIRHPPNQRASQALATIPRMSARELGPGIATLRVDRAGLEQLLRDPNIQVGYDRPVQAFLADSAPLIRASQVWSELGITGEGQTICVLDTGVDYTHPDFGACEATSNINDGNCPKVIGGYNYIHNNNNPIDDHYHGTHVSGIAASEHATNTGVAPGAKIVAVKVLNSSGSGTGSTIYNGIVWCTNNAQALNISVITMSLGTPEFYVNTCDALDGLGVIRDAIQAARDQGILVSVAAGNEYHSTNAPYLGMAWPACLSAATSVGSTTKADAYSGFSQRDVSTTLLAPGTAITATYPGGGQAQLSGTSMAAPHVSGAAALLQQYFQTTYQRSLSVKDVELRLATAGVQLNDPITGLKLPRIDIEAAIQGKGIIPTEPAEPFWTSSDNPQNCGELFENQTCTLSWTVNATGSQGTYDFFAIFIAEHAINESPHVPVTFSSPPTTVADVPSGWQSAPFNVTLNATDNHSDIAYTSYRVNGGAWVNGTVITINTTGNHTIDFFSENNASQREEVKTAHAALDLTTPTTIADAPSGWQGAPFNVTLSATDNHSGVNATWHRLNEGNWTQGTVIEITAIGNNTVEYYSTDQVGNQEETRTVYAALDNQPPTTIANIPSGWQNMSFNVTLNATDDHSGVAYTSYRVNGGAWVNGTAITINTTGNHTIQYFSVDNAGTVESQQTAYAALDTLAPVTVVDAPSGWQGAPFNVTLNATDDHSGVAYTSYRVNGGAWVNGTVITINTTGNHTIDFYSEDNNENREEQQSITAALDTLAPVTVVDAPSGWQNMSFNVTLNATDNHSGVNTTWHRLNEGNWTQEDTILIAIDGAHTIEYYSQDLAGNTEEPQNITVFLDSALPVISEVTLTPENPVREQNLTLQVMITAINITEVNVTIEGNNSAMEATGENEYSHTFNASEQNHTVTITAKDHFNRTVQETLTVRTYQAHTTQGTLQVNQTINATENLKTVVKLALNQTTDGEVTLLSEKFPPSGLPQLPLAARYVRVQASQSVNDNLTYAVIEILLEPEEASALVADSWRLAWYNQTAQEWQDLHPSTHHWVNAVGRNGNAAWANVTHFSDYAITGDEPQEPAQPTPPSSGTGGGGGGGGGLSGGGRIALNSSEGSQELVIRFAGANTTHTFEIDIEEVALKQLSLRTTEQIAYEVILVTKENVSVENYQVLSAFSVRTRAAITDLELHLDTVADHAVLLWQNTSWEPMQLETTANTTLKKTLVSGPGVFALAVPAPQQEPSEPLLAEETQEQEPTAQVQELNVLEPRGGHRNAILMVALLLTAIWGIVALLLIKHK